MLRSLSVSLEEGFALETKNAQLVLTTEDAREGPRAFMEKRPLLYWTLTVFDQQLTS